MDVNSLEAKLVQMGVDKLDRRANRLAARRFFFFLRLRFLLRKVRFLKGE